MTALWTAALAAVAVAYVWRWRTVRGALPMRRMWAFVAGLAALWAAVASPLAHMDHAHLTAHMVQHLVIMTVAAPLLLFGEPALVLLDKAPPWSPHPAICWIAGTFTVVVWHVPGVFELGMQWHGLQHATFLVAGLLFWLPVLQPRPTEYGWSRWWIVLYLFLATLPCDALSAFLAFCGRVIYPHYGTMHHHAGGLSALDDQERAGALMWFWVTFAYLVPAALVTVELLSSKDPVRA
ncbi:MAG TPA: cytochrome c oxidase assembly protein [Haliangiales bacterium]|nr:cytochrome c oxidase assembly protein [Haliangiales bacterium]